MAYRRAREVSTDGAEALRREMAFEPEEERAAYEHRAPLTPEQAEVFHAVLDSMGAAPADEHGRREMRAQKPGDRRAGPNVFYVDGPGGSGKTFLYESLIRWVRGEGHLPVVVAMSGIAALLLPGGTTAHSRFKLPVPLPLEQAAAGITMQSAAADVLRHASCLIWDEAPTAPRAAIDAVDRCLRDVRGIDRPFGGLPTLLGGDFRQTPPVLRHVERSDFPAHTLKASRVWKTPGAVRTFALTENKRAEGDADFAAFLMQIGEGTWVGPPEAPAPASSSSPATVLLPPEICEPPTSSAQNLLDWVYEGLPESPEEQLQFYAERAVVAPTNEAAAALNAVMLDRLPGGAAEFLSHDSIPGDQDAARHFPTEFLNTLDSGGLPPHALRLKPGAVLIAIRNFAPHLGVCNGTRLLLERAGSRLLHTRIISGPKQGDRVLIPRITCDSAGEGDLPFRMRRFQFPVRHAWSITINKAQGQTLGGRVGVYLPKPVFTHGQLYVALSRATSAAGVRVFAETLPDCQGYSGRCVQTLNVVHREYLADAPNLGTRDADAAAASADVPGSGPSPTTRAADMPLHQPGSPGVPTAPATDPGATHPGWRDEGVSPPDVEKTSDDAALTPLDHAAADAVGEPTRDAWINPPRHPAASLAARGSGPLADIEVWDRGIGERAAEGIGHDQQQTDDADDAFEHCTNDAAASLPNPTGLHAAAGGRRSAALPAWIEVERQRDEFCAVHALNNVCQGRLPPRFTDDALFEGATEAAWADLNIRHYPHADVHANPASGFFSTEAVTAALKRRGIGTHGCAILPTPEETFRNAFDSFPVASDEAEKAVLGIFVHHGAHYTAIVRDKDDALLAWHVESKYGGRVDPLRPGEFLALLEDPAVLTLKIGADPVRWYSGARAGVPADDGDAADPETGPPLD